MSALSLQLVLQDMSKLKQTLDLMQTTEGPIDREGMGAVARRMSGIMTSLQDIQKTICASTENPTPMASSKISSVSSSAATAASSPYAGVANQPAPAPSSFASGLPFGGASANSPFSAFADPSRGIYFGGAFAPDGRGGIVPPRINSGHGGMYMQSGGPMTGTATANIRGVPPSSPNFHDSVNAFRAERSFSSTNDFQTDCLPIISSQGSFSFGGAMTLSNKCTGGRMIEFERLQREVSGLCTMIRGGSSRAIGIGQNEWIRFYLVPKNSSVTITGRGRYENVEEKTLLVGHPLEGASPANSEILRQRLQDVANQQDLQLIW